MTWIEIYTRRLVARTGARSILICRDRGGVVLASILPRYPSVAGVLCHSDLHTQNLIERDAALMLLDWEYAHVTDPLWDLAGWSANNDFEADAQRIFLADYLGGAPTAAHWARFRLLVWLYDYICLLWSGFTWPAGRRPAFGLIRAYRRATQLDARLRIPAHYRA